MNSTTRLPVKYKSKKSILVSNKKGKEGLNLSSRISGFRKNVNLGMLENVYNRSTKLIHSPNLYNEKFSQEKPSKKKRKSHGLNKMIVEFQQNFLSKKGKPTPQKHNLQKLVKNFTSTKTGKGGVFDKRRSFTQKLNDTMNLLKKSNKTYNNGIQKQIKSVATTDFKELQTSLLNKVSQKGKLEKFLDGEKAKKGKAKSKRKSLTATSWYRNGKKAKLLKRYSKKAKGKTYKKKHSMKTKKQDSGDSGISFGEKESKLQMAKSETVPGFVIEKVNFQSSFDNKSSFSKVAKSRQEVHEIKSLIPHLTSKQNMSEFPFSKYSQKNTDERCLPSIYMKSHSEFEANESNSIFSPKIDKDFVLSKEDNPCLMKIDTFQNNYHFNSKLSCSVKEKEKSKAGVSLKNLELPVKKVDKNNIYEINSIEKFQQKKRQDNLQMTSNYSNYSNYVSRTKFSNFENEERFAKKINSSNNLPEGGKTEKELPSFKPVKNKSFNLRQNQVANLKANLGAYSKKKGGSRRMNRIKKTFEFPGNVSLKSQKTQKNTDRNRECKSLTEVLESIHQDIEKFNIQSKTSIENSCLKGLKSAHKIKAKFGAHQKKHGMAFKSLKKEKQIRKGEINRCSSTMINNPFNAHEPVAKKTVVYLNHSSTKNINIFGKEESRDILSEKSESYVTVAKYKKQHKSKMNRSQDNYFNLPLLKNNKNQQISERINIKSSKDSMAFLTPEVSEIKLNNYDMSFNCFSNAGVSFEMPASAQENITKSHSDSESLT